MTVTELYNTFLEFVEKGDEKGARAFLIEHLNDFPQEVKEKIAFGFFEEAVLNDSAGLKEMSELQQTGKDALEEMAQSANALEEAKKAIEIKESL